MHIKIEDLTPKLIINFYPSKPIAVQNSALLFTSSTENGIPLLAQNIMAINGIKRCLITDELLAILYEDINAKEDIIALILAEIDDYFNENNFPLVFQQNLNNITLIEALADSFIRPTLNRDNGDIKILAYQNDILTIQFTGHCAGCPYAQNTLNNVISNCLKRYIPKLKTIQIKE